MTISGFLKSPAFKQWELAQLGRHETVNTSEHYSPRVAGSIPVRSNFFCWICFALNEFWQNYQNDSILGKTWNTLSLLCFRCRDVWEMHLVYQGGVPEEAAAEQASVHTRLLRRGHPVHEVPRQHSPAGHHRNQPAKSCASTIGADTWCI